MEKQKRQGWAGVRSARQALWCNKEEDGLGFACLFGITRMHAASLMCLDYQKCSQPLKLEINSSQLLFVNQSFTASFDPFI